MRRLLAFAGMLLFSQMLYGGSVVGSKHDLSTGTPGGTQVCGFCHAPHSTATTPPALLWNRGETTATFQLYGSLTMDTSPVQPRGVSRLCLSCHDGVASYTVMGAENKHNVIKAEGNRIGELDTTSTPNCQRCHDVGGEMYIMRRIGTDLRNDHPVSMSYPTPAQDPFFNAPPDGANGWGGQSKNDVKLYAGSVECGSCHNVHNPDYGRFLRKSNAGSLLCLTCHNK